MKVPCAFYVGSLVSLNDAGAGSLRQAILDANTLPDLNEIIFTVPGGAGTFRAFVNGIELDGVTNSGYEATRRGCFCVVPN